MAASARTCRRRPCGHGFPACPSAFTIIEVLAAIVVAAILLAITIPAMASVRLRNQQLKCTVNLRSIDTLVQMYASGQRDFFPTWMDRGVDYESTPSRWLEYGAQGATTFEHRKWLDFTGFVPTTETQYCPANTWYPEAYGRLAAPDYWISSSAYVQPGYLDPDLPQEICLDRLGARPQRHSAARFPSSKAGVFEMFVWHGWKGRHCEGCPVHDLEFHNADRPASVVFLDGHADLRVAATAARPVPRYPTWPSMIYDTTPHGILGRDVQ